MSTQFNMEETLFNSHHAYHQGRCDQLNDDFDIIETKLRSEDGRMAKSRHKSAIKHLPELRTRQQLRNEVKRHSVPGLHTHEGNGNVRALLGVFVALCVGFVAGTILVGLLP